MVLGSKKKIRLALLNKQQSWIVLLRNFVFSQKKTLLALSNQGIFLQTFWQLVI